MTFYGPWIQAPDYEEVTSLSTAPGSQNFGYFEATVDRPVILGHYEFNDAEVWAAQRAVQMSQLSPPVGSDPGLAAGGPMIFRTSYVSVLLPGDIIPSILRSTLKASWFYGAGGVTPYVLGASNWAPFLTPGGTPSGTIGYQWQSDLSNGARPSTVVRALVGGTYDGGALYSEGGIEDEMPTGPFVTGIFTSGADFASVPAHVGAFYGDEILNWNGPSGRLVTEISSPDGAPSEGEWGPFDITLDLDGTGRAALYHQMVFDTGNGPYAMPNPDESSTAGYGHTITTAVTWTLRPPVFRWIYDRSTVAPPLRRRQRDDDAINNNRNGGRGSRQHSLRNSGYL